MKKTLILAAVALSTCCASVSAQTLVTNENIGDQIRPGAVIALNCMNTTGGLNTWFNGAATKSSTFSYENLFSLEATETDGTVTIKRLSDGKYLGVAGGNFTGQPLVTAVESVSDAVSFNISIPEVAGDNYNGWADNEYAGTGFERGVNTVRFTVAGSAYILNMNNANLTPKYHTGHGGFSAWFVYTYSEEEVEALAPKKFSPDESAQYLLQIKGGLDCYMQMLEPATDKQCDIIDQLATVSQTIITPIQFVKDPSDSTSSKFAIKCVETEKYLYVSGWCTVINHEEPYYWTITLTSDDNLHIAQNEYFGGGDSSHNLLGVQSVAPGTKVFTDNFVGKPGAIVDWELIEVNEEIEYTIVCKYKGQEVSRETGTNYAGVQVLSTTPLFFADEPTKVTLVSGQDTYEVELTQPTLPFQWTETTDNMIWQAVQQHYTYQEREGGQYTNNYTWTYDAEDSNTMVASYGVIVNKNGFTDNQLWAFVGNYSDGFKIYNKAAGMENWLYSDGTNVKVGKGEENNLWKVYPTDNLTDRPASVYCALKADNTSYININVNVNNATHLNHWTGADDGSSIWFYSAAEPVLTYCQNNNNFEGSNVVGKCAGYDNVPDNISELIAAAEANPYDVDAVNALKPAIANAVALPVNVFNADKWYRLYTSGREADRHGFLCISSENSQIWSAENSFGNHNAVVKFEPVADTENRYHITSQGNYFGHVTSGAAVNHIAASEETSNRGEFVVNPVENSATLFQIKDAASSDSRYNMVHQQEDNLIVGWEDGSASHWELHYASLVEVALTHTDADANVGLACFPFPVKANGDGSKLYYIYEDTYKGTTTPVVTYAEVKSVPAGVAFMIRNEELSNVTLAIDYNGVMATADPKNIIAGGFRKSTAEAGDYMLEATDSGLAFVPKTEAPEVAANYAYLPAAQLTSNALAAENLPLADPSTTAIDEISVEGGVAEGIYDLQGRRLAAPVKGINIINGKKVLVK